MVQRETPEPLQVSYPAPSGLPVEDAAQSQVPPSSDEPESLPASLEEAQPPLPQAFASAHPYAADVSLQQAAWQALPQNPASVPMPVLQCQDLIKSYDAFPALGPVSLKLYPGRIVGLLGPNGSGKTTFIKTVAGLLTPSHGEVKICGLSPGAKTKALVSYLPERTYLSNWMKVADALDYFESFYEDFDRARAFSMLADLQVPLLAYFSKLSKGTKEKVQLILVMARRSKLYLLDEPIAGVDPAAREYILNTIIANYDRSAANVISTHLITDVESVLDDYIFINRGQIVSAGPVSAVYEAGWPSLDAYFREAFRC
ncbi:MAG: ABC transporter ATP-binding protein [Coriobacteriia bacterium]|nr:ABC transporter ATP-binding protein [Coriobacteriia bacterium]